MGTDSGSGETSCDEASKCVTPIDIPHASTFNSININWGRDDKVCSRPRLREQPQGHGRYFPVEEDAAESAQSDVSGITDSDTNQAAGVKCEEEITACNRNKKLRNVCTFKGCLLSFNRPWRLEAHLRVHNGERPFKCTVEGCNKDYSNNAHLRRHMTRNHSTEKSRVKYNCPVADCFMLLSSTTALKRHIERKHTTQFHCAVCHMAFSKQSELKIHSFQHMSSAVLPYQCDICQLSFAMKRECSRHRLRKHRTYSCNHPDCAQNFPTWSLLLKHLKIEHPATKYVCDVCNRTFALKVNLRIHLETHSDPGERKTYPCAWEGCTKCYYHVRNLTAHINSCHRGKLFLCSHQGCNKQLRSKQKLHNHHQRHTTASLKVKPPRGVSKKRRDVGKAKRSMTSRLLGVVLPRLEEKKLLHNDDTFMLSDSSLSEATLMESLA